MKKWVCPVCGYVHEGDTPPEKCPVCKVPGERFTLQAEELSWAAEHVLGVGKVFGADVPEDVKEHIIAGLRSNFEGECSEVGMYLADSTKKNLQMRVDAENGATAGKFELAKLAKKYNLDAIHDTVHEMARDEARHGKAFKGLLERYFGK